MKEKDARIEEESNRMILYVEKEDRSIGPIETGSFMAKNYLDDFFEKRRHLRETLLARLQKGEISPVAYYLTLIDIAEADLAKRVGVSRRRLRKHLTPGGFAGISLELAGKYAEVFAIPVAGLFQITVTEGDRVEVSQEKTANPLVTIGRVREKKA